MSQTVPLNITNQTPRTQFTKRLAEEEEMLTDLTMNFDPYTISLLKRDFERKNGKMGLNDFVKSVMEHLKNWRTGLANREMLLVKLIIQLFKDIDINGNGDLEWDEFTNYIIEKANILTNNQKNRPDSIKNYGPSTVLPLQNIESVVEKLINMESLDRFACIEDFSNVVKFYHPETGQQIGRNLKINYEETRYIAGSTYKPAPLKKTKRVIVHNAIFLPEHEYQVLLTSCNDGSVRTWTCNGSQFHSANYEGGYPLLACKNVQRSLAWDGVNHLLYSGEGGGAINIWNFGDSKKTEPVKVLKSVHDQMVTDLLAIPKLEFLISCSQDRKVVLWDTISCMPRRIYGNHTKGVLSLAFNPEYRLLFSAGFDHDIYVWNPYIDTVAFTIEGHNSSLVGVRVIPDSPQIISADIDGWVKIWDVRNLSCVQSFNLEEKQTGKRFTLTDFQYLNDQLRIVFAGKSMLFYDYDRNQNPMLVDDTMPQHSVFTPKYNKIITSVTNKLKIWNAFTGSQENFYAQSADSEISYMEIDEWEKRVIVGDTKGRTRVYNIKNGALMKTLAQHSAEVNCISQSCSIQAIATSSLDLTIMIHDDKELSDTSIIKTIHLSAVNNIVKLVSHLDVLITGSADGSIQVWDYQQGALESNPMVILGEPTAILPIRCYPLAISCDSVGDICFWALHPLPYKYSLIVRLTCKEDDIISPILAACYDEISHTLFISDEKGTVKALSCEELIRVLGIAKMSENGEENRMMSVNSKHQLTVPEISADIITEKYHIKVHNEPIRHLYFIKDPQTLITTSYDRRVKLIDAATGTQVGALQQGAGANRIKSSVKKADQERLAPWNFHLDILKIIQEEESEVYKILRDIKRRETGPKRTKKKTNLPYIPPSDIDFDTNNPSKLSKVLEIEKTRFGESTYSRNYSDTTKHDDFTQKYSIENAKNGYVPLDLMFHKSAQSSLDIYMAYKKKKKHLSKKTHPLDPSRHLRPPASLSKVTSLPAITKDLSKIPIERTTKLKLSSSCFKAAQKLAGALNESFF